MDIIVKTQAELDAALAGTYTDTSYIYLHGGTADDPLVVRVNPKNAYVVAWGSSSVVAWGSSSVVARESSRVVAWGSSRVVARESSSVVARESSRVVAWGSSSVVAWGSSSVEAWGSSSVVAWGSSSVEAWGSSSVVARESSRVVARGSSRVVAWGSSRVEARESSSVHVQSTDNVVDLFGFAVAILVAHAKKVLKKERTATIVRVKASTKKGADAWLAREGVADGKTVVLYKRVSKDWKTREGTPNETTWAPGTTVTHADWSPESGECGAGKFHACSRAYFCDEFRNDKRDDRYIAIQIKKKDLHVWEGGSYPHKVAFREGVVLYECDHLGAERRPAPFYVGDVVVAHGDLSSTEKKHTATAAMRAYAPAATRLRVVEVRYQKNHEYDVVTRPEGKTTDTYVWDAVDLQAAPAGKP